MAKSNLNMNALNAAVATPDTDVAMPTRQSSSSLVSQIASLDVGDSASKVTQVDSTMSLGEYAQQGVEMRERLRQSVSSSLRVAKGRTGGEYEIEIADLMTTKRVLYIVAIVTRTA